MKKTILKRLNERSTWAGLAALAVLFGVDAVKANMVAEAMAGLAAAAAVIIPDGAVVPAAGQ
ncbi:hypothetical protein [Massilia sp. GCM10023247]|uniref:hypothetical protein n=1 Tax=Massilia sp. GCM10023247 TaxID=3252643 RepID=UPI00362283CD